jgi:predicted 3-demethylubiquinone-9 3-methyltransferase (glyoxalase superfamily)
MKKIHPFLWFNGNAEEAMNFYVSVFAKAQIGEVRRFGKGGPAPEGSVMSASFMLEDQEFTALNGGMSFPFTPAVSFFVSCEDQAEVDSIWEKFAAGGEVLQCGWIKDRFGLTWQVVPKQLGEMLQDPDSEKSARAMQAMLKMKKLDVAALRRAFEGA